MPVAEEETMPAEKAQKHCAVIQVPNETPKKKHEEEQNTQHEDSFDRAMVNLFSEAFVRTLRQTPSESEGF